METKRVLFWLLLLLLLLLNFGMWVKGHSRLFELPFSILCMVYIL